MKLFYWLSDTLLHIVVPIEENEKHTDKEIRNFRYVMGAILISATAFILAKML